MIISFFFRFLLFILTISLKLEVIKIKIKFKSLLHIVDYYFLILLNDFLICLFNYSLTKLKFI